VQVPVRLRRKARDHASAVLAGALVFGHDRPQEVGSRRRNGCGRWPRRTRRCSIISGFRPGRGRRMMRHCSIRHNLFMNNCGQSVILTTTRHPVIGRPATRSLGTPCEPAPVKGFQRAIVAHVVRFSTIAVDKSVHILYIRALSGPPAGEIVAMPNLTPSFHHYFSMACGGSPGSPQTPLTAPTVRLFVAAPRFDVQDKSGLARNMSNDQVHFTPRIRS